MSSRSGAAVRVVGRPMGRLWLGIMVLMSITGMGQMPIFKRYYIADLPGLGWLADPYTVHWVHYVGATLLMGVGAWLVMAYYANRGRIRLTASGVVRLLLLAGIVVTGYMRVAKNLPDFHFSPLTTVLIDWTHLGFAVLLGLAALLSRMLGAAAYLHSRPSR